MSLLWIAPFISFAVIALLVVIFRVIYLSCYRIYAHRRDSNGVAVVCADTNTTTSQGGRSNGGGCSAETAQAIIYAEAGLVSNVYPTTVNPRPKSKHSPTATQKKLYTNPPLVQSPLHYDISNRRYKSVTNGMPLPATSKRTGNYSRKHGNEYEGIARLSQAQELWRNKMRGIVGSRIEAMRSSDDGMSSESEEDELDGTHVNLELDYSLEKEIIEALDLGADHDDQVGTGKNDHDSHNTFSLKLPSMLNAKLSLKTSSIGSI